MQSLTQWTVKTNDEDANNELIMCVNADIFL